MGVILEVHNNGFRVRVTNSSTKGSIASQDFDPARQDASDACAKARARDEAAAWSAFGSSVPPEHYMIDDVSSRQISAKANEPKPT